MIKRNHFIARIAHSQCLVNGQLSDFSESHLLVYESPIFSEGQLSQDVRDVLEKYPFTSEISVLAPRVAEEMLLKQVDSETVQLRVDHPACSTITISVLIFDRNQNFITAQRNAALGPQLVQPLSESLKNAWIFDLFHRNKCLVTAPDGIHFGKTSGKHSDQFLRAANALVGSLECELLAFFLLPFASKLKPQRIYVDTGPLISVGLALSDQCIKRELWSSPPSMQSFSSYDGLDLISNAPPDHLILISASTSGGLENKIIERTQNISRVATIFYIQGTSQTRAASYLVGNITESESGLYGYSEIATHDSSKSCDWCNRGLPFAEFEGDQFLLQKRKTQKINIAYHPTNEANNSLKKSARDFFLEAKSKGIFSVRLTAGEADGYREVLIDKEKLTSSTPGLLKFLEKSLQKFPLDLPIHFLVSDDFTSEQMGALQPYSVNGKQSFLTATFTTELQKHAAIKKGNALVAFALIDSLHTPRKISEILRSVVPDGEVVYSAMATIVESPEEFKQLGSALRTGAKGPRTFTYAEGAVLFFRRRFEVRTTWQYEKDWLEGLVEEDLLKNVMTPPEITARLAFLKRTGHAEHDLFWSGQNGEALRLQHDFVYLPVSDDESQADIYAIVSNLLSTAIQFNRSATDESPIGDIRRALRDTVYSEALIDPNNFLKFNDAILRAALLRAASPTELNYSRDLDLSGMMTSLIVHEIAEWQFSRGQMLSEFITAIATDHLRLCTQHMDQIKKSISRSVYLPPYIKRLGSGIPGSISGDQPKKNIHLSIIKRLKNWIQTLKRY